MTAPWPRESAPAGRRRGRSKPTKEGLFERREQALVADRPSYGVHAAARPPRSSVCVPGGGAARTERNPNVAEAQAILRTEALLDQAKAVFRPTVQGDVGTTILDAARGFSGNITQPRTQTAFAGTASYPFFAPSRWALKSQAADQVGIARISAEEVRQQVALAAARPTSPSSGPSISAISRAQPGHAVALESSARPPRRRPGHPAHHVPRPRMSRLRRPGADHGAGVRRRRMTLGRHLRGRRRGGGPLSPDRGRHSAVGQRHLARPPSRVGSSRRRCRPRPRRARQLEVRCRKGTFLHPAIRHAAGFFAPPGR